MTVGNYSNVGHRGPVYKCLGAMNPCDLLHIMMHGPQNVKIINAQQARQIYQYKNIKENCIRPKQQYGITKHADKNS
jgi:hypothetical protein